MVEERHANISNPDIIEFEVEYEFRDVSYLNTGEYRCVYTALHSRDTNLFFSSVYVYVTGELQLSIALKINSRLLGL